MRFASRVVDRAVSQPSSPEVPSMATKPISSEFPYESRFVDVQGSRMHYIDEGSGDPI